MSNPVPKTAILVGALSAVGCQFIVDLPVLQEKGYEACSNRIDDDLDGDIDCDDAECLGTCPEDSRAFCENGIDEDSDGVFDAAEVSCWPFREVHVNEGPRGCRRIDGASFQLSSEDSDWMAHTSRSECGDSGTSACAVVPARPHQQLWGSANCTGSGVTSRECGHVRSATVSTGGPCWELSVRVRPSETTSAGEVAVVVAPNLDNPPMRSGNFLVAALRWDERATGLVLRGTSDTLASIDLSGFRPPIDVRLSASGDPEASDPCSSETYGTVHVEAREAFGLGGAIVSEAVAAQPGAPFDWPAEASLQAGVQMVAPGQAVIESLDFRRSALVRCPSALPQISEPGANVRVLSSAVRGDQVCAIGFVSRAPLVEAEFDAYLNQAWWPPAPVEGIQEFISWSMTIDRSREESLPTALDGPHPAELPIEGSIPSGAVNLASDGQFEAIILVREDPGDLGRLVRLVSSDCRSWVASPLVDDGFRGKHPMGWSTVHGNLLLAKPAAGIEQRVRRDGFECGFEPLGVFRAPANDRPFIKPVKSDCFDIRFRPATLESVRVEDGRMVESARRFSFPALQGICTGCVCNCASSEFEFTGALPEDFELLDVHQVHDLGGNRAYVTTDLNGIQLIVDDTFEDPPADAPSEPFAVPDDDAFPLHVLSPSGIPGTFDSHSIEWAHMLVLQASPRRVSGLLFYEGYSDVEFDRDLGLRYYRNGAVGITRFTIE